MITKPISILYPYDHANICFTQTQLQDHSRLYGLSLLQFILCSINTCFNLFIH